LSIKNREGGFPFSGILRISGEGEPISLILSLIFLSLIEAGKIRKTFIKMDKKNPVYYIVCYSKERGSPIVFLDDWMSREVAFELANKTYNLHPDWLVFVQRIGPVE